MQASNPKYNSVQAGLSVLGCHTSMAFEDGDLLWERLLLYVNIYEGTIPWVRKPKLLFLFNGYTLTQTYLWVVY